MISAGIVGGSGYAGGELLRLLLQHPEVEIEEVTSVRHAGEPVTRVHPNLKGLTDLKFRDTSPVDAAGNVDVIFLAVPHGTSAGVTPKIVEQGTRVIDLSADFRLRDPNDYPAWYGWEHPAPDLLGKFVYGLPEIHRDEIRNSHLVAVPGCISSSAIYSLAPLSRGGYLDGITVVDAKIGSSGSGNRPGPSTHFSEKYNSVRIYSPSGHRHIAEIEQELGYVSKKRISVTMSAHSVNMVRGILTTSSVFTEEMPSLPELWSLYRSFYADEPFIRFIMDKKGLYRFPDPKITVGSNFADIGFELDTHVKRIVAIAAIDNLLKGTAGNAVHSMNIMMGFRETEALGLVPMRVI